jgi:calcineurin-like phosphoesterase family protein/flagellar hook capping protein FlgD
MNTLYQFYIYLVLTILILLANLSQAQSVSFVVGADNRDFYPQFRFVLDEVNDMTLNPAPQIPFPQFFIACGDFDPVANNMAIYNDTLTYPHLPPFYPVVGNHEFETPADMSYILNLMIPNLQNVVNYGQQGMYSFDYGNGHFIVLDEYVVNTEGEVDPELQIWLQQDLNNTNKDHVFVFGHEPAFPRFRHTGDALNQFPESRNAFWNILMIDPRVHAYICGHTHYYYRMRVADPTSVGATGFPNQEGGVYQVDVGAIGQSLGDGNLTLVYVHVENDLIRFRTITSPRDTIQWALADQWSITNVSRFSMQLIEPQSGNEISGATNVTWAVFKEIDSSMVTNIYFSRDAGSHWDSLWSDQTIDTTYAWNTLNHPDGTRYMLLIVSEDDSGFGLTRSSGTFTVNNPGNALPEIELTSPNRGELIGGDFLVTWNAADADGDSLWFSLDMTTNAGFTWQQLLVNAQSDTSFPWNTRSFPNSPTFQLRLRCSDNIVEVADTSDIFEIYNEHPAISDTLISHISGISNANVQARIAFPDSVKEGNVYRVTIDDTLYNYKSYNVHNMQTGSMVVQNATQFDGVTEGPLFDGMRLVIKDFDPAVVNSDSTGWLIGSSTLDISIFLPIINVAGNIIEGFPYPANYKMHIFDHIVDTSSTAFGAPANPMKFSVYNVTENHSAEIIFLDNDIDSTISRADVVYILENDSVSEPMFTWAMSFSGQATATNPIPGDEYVIKTLKPLTIADVYEFSPIVSDIYNDPVSLPQELKLFQNFPNPFNLSTTIKYNLPQKSKVELKIFNILGQEIKTLYYGTQTPGNKSIVWNGKNQSNKVISSGIYFYYLKVGESVKVRKMIVMK